MANDINKVILVGRLTRDVELSYTPGNNTALAKFAIAVNEVRGNNREDEVYYFDIVVWGKMAEICNQYLAKGRQVIIDGKLRQQRYQDKQGQNRTSISVVADNVQFIGGNDRQSSQNGLNQGFKDRVNLDNSFEPLKNNNKFISELIDDLSKSDDIPF